VESRSDGKAWTFLTNHARVMICIAQAPEARVRDIAEKIGITERATHLIISDLENAGYLTRTRIGRRNAYTVNPDRPFRHPAEADHDVHALITLFTGHDEARQSRPNVQPPAAREETPPMSTAPALTAQVSQQGGYAVVTAAGSIDFTTRPLLEEHLDQALRLTQLAVIVDLSKVHFCDSVGLNVFLRARRPRHRRGHRRTAEPSRICLRHHPPRPGFLSPARSGDRHSMAGERHQPPRRFHTGRRFHTASGAGGASSVSADPMTTDTSIHPEHAPVDNPFTHPALFYSGEQDYLDGTLPFVRRGLHAGDPVAAAVPGPNLDLLREGLGEDASAVAMIDMQVGGRNPGRIIPGVLAAFADAHPGAHRVWIIGEPIWPGRSPQEYPACVQHEALINRAFTGRSVSIMCPYDLEGLDPAVVADAKATHPIIRRSGQEEISRAYAPDDIIDTYNQPLPAPHPNSGAVTVLDFTAGNLHQVRQAAAEQAAGHTMTPDRVNAVELVVNELAVNSIRHGGGSGTLRVWAEDGLFICEVTDKGHLTDPLAGRRHAGLSTEGGRGLLLAHYTSDLVRLYTTPTGTTIRAHFTLPTPPPTPADLASRATARIRP